MEFDRPIIDPKTFHLVDEAEVVPPLSLQELLSKFKKATESYNEVSKVIAEARRCEMICLEELANLKRDIDYWFKENVKNVAG